jgi:acetoacetate decarboxylase
MRGFTLPFSPRGIGSAVKPPPWHFALDCLLFDYRIEPAALRAYLPAGLEVDPEAPGAVQIAICDGSCVSAEDRDQAARAPGEVNYRECLVKLGCLHRGERIWHVAVSWVTNDHSLLRGFLMGFPKRLGEVDVTNFHRLGGHAGGRAAGQRLGARVRTSDGLSLHQVQHCDHKIDALAPPARAFVMRRCIPALTPGSSADELVRLVVRSSTTSDIWTGPGEMQIFVGDSDTDALFRAVGPVDSTSFVTAFDVGGIEPIG